MTAWNPKILNVSPFLTTTGYLLEVKWLGWDQPVNLLNYYGPYQNREQFWNTFYRMGACRRRI